MSRVLFVGVRNAGRSQIAEALFDQIAAAVTKGGPAGSKPGKQVHPRVVEAMGELGIDLQPRLSKTNSARVEPQKPPISHRDDLRPLPDSEKCLPG